MIVCPEMVVYRISATTNYNIDHDRLNSNSISLPFIILKLRKAVTRMHVFWNRRCRSSFTRKKTDCVTHCRVSNLVSGQKRFAKKKKNTINKQNFVRRLLYASVRFFGAGRPISPPWTTTTTGNSTQFRSECANVIHRCGVFIDSDTYPYRFSEAFRPLPAGRTRKT